MAPHFSVTSPLDGKSSRSTTSTGETAVIYGPRDKNKRSQTRWVRAHGQRRLPKGEPFTAATGDRTISVTCDGDNQHLAVLRPAAVGVAFRHFQSSPEATRSRSRQIRRLAELWFHRKGTGTTVTGGRVGWLLSAIGTSRTLRRGRTRQIGVDRPRREVARSTTSWTSPEQTHEVRKTTPGILDLFNALNSNVVSPESDGGKALTS
jgi:hypothetical protein